MSRLLEPLRVSVFVLLSCGAPAAPAAAAGPDAQVAEAARRELLDQALAARLADPEVAVTVLGDRSRRTGCAEPARIEALDVRHPSRMRFAVHCAGQAAAEFVVRATVSARVVVAAAAIEAGRPIAADELSVERRPLATIAEPVSAPEEVVGLSSRRALRAGRIVDKRWLVEPLLVRRGAAVRIVARRGAIEVSAAGEALESGRRGEIVSVRNAETGGVIRARVTAGNVVEPADIP